MANPVSASAAPYQLNGAMLGGLVIDPTSKAFEGLSGGTTGSYDLSLSSSINNRNIIGALNSIVGGDALAVGVSGSVQIKGASGFDGGPALLWSDVDGMSMNAALNVSGAADFAGILTVDGLASLDAGIDVNGANFTVSSAGAVTGQAGDLASLALNSGGITAAGAISGVSTLSGSGKFEALELEVGRADSLFTVSTLGAVTGQAGDLASLALNSGGITAAGAIAGVTSLSGNAALDMGTMSLALGQMTVSSTGKINTQAAVIAVGALKGVSLANTNGSFDVSSAGDVGANSLTATTSVSAGSSLSAVTSISGASAQIGNGLFSVAASGDMSANSLTATTSVDAGSSLSAVTSISGASAQIGNGLFSVGAGGNMSANSLTATTSVDAGSSLSAITSISGASVQIGNGNFSVAAGGESNFMADATFGSGTSSTLTLRGSNAAGDAKAFRLSVSGGLLSVDVI